MELTYDWKITAMKKAPVLEGLSDVITHIRFDYTGTDADSGETHVFPGACPIGLPDTENFTELASLTEADVIEWVKANHPTDHMNEVITKAITQKVSPTNVEADMPWAPTEQIPE